MIHFLLFIIVLILIHQCYPEVIYATGRGIAFITKWSLIIFVVVVLVALFMADKTPSQPTETETQKSLQLQQNYDRLNKQMNLDGNQWGDCPRYITDPLLAITEKCRINPALQGDSHTQGVDL